MGGLLVASLGTAQGAAGSGQVGVMASATTGVAAAVGGETPPAEPGLRVRRPNGRIVYEGWPAGSGEIYTIRADGSGKQRLTHNDTFDHGPDWSPSGRRLLFGHYDDAIGTVQWTMRPDGTDKRPIPNTWTGLHPSWSPSGYRIAFVCHDGNDFEICVIRRDGTHSHQITHNAVADNHPDWAPGGGRIAYDSHDGEDQEIYTIRANGGDRQKITHNTMDDWWPSYSPSGAWIAHESGVPDTEVFVQRVDGSGRLRQVTDDSLDTYMPSWSPDGTRIAYVQWNGTQTDVYTIRLSGSGEQQVTHTAINELHPKWGPRPS